ncbi:MAG: rhodanese-like domain-containing protein [Actinomycetota bacterium]|nr:rhodanese-like domain-containing protein [Actinomycetota bacterium]
MNPFGVPTVSVADVPEAAVLLDCREHGEWSAGHIGGAVHIPMNEIPIRSSELSPHEQIVVVCKVGSRSAHVTGWLNRNGYDAVNLDGGMLAWATSGRPMITDDGSTPHVA